MEIITGSISIQSIFESNLYIFKKDLPYYYVITKADGGESCIPIACGIDQHISTLFSKQ